MTRASCVLVLILAESLIGVHPIVQEAPPPKDRVCRMVDIIATKTRDIYYVDGIEVPQNRTVIEYLRRLEASSPTRCLRLFVPTSVKIQDVEDMRVVAGKMQYQEFHAYLYDQHREWVNEILPGPPVSTTELRFSPRGTIHWPDLQPGAGSNGQRPF
jgi:hypothetical protein